MTWARRPTSPPGWATIVGHLASFFIAVAIMVSINLTITLVIFLPLVVTIVSSYLAWARIAGRLARRGPDRRRRDRLPGRAVRRRPGGQGRRRRGAR